MRRLHPAQIEEAIRLRKQENLSTPTIARRCVISNHSAYRILRRYPWRPPLKRRVFRGIEWTDRDVNTLRRLYPSAEQDEVMAALPGRSWIAIGRQASFLKVRRVTKGTRLNKRTVHPLMRQLRAERDRRGLSRQQVSDKAGWHLNQILAWEMGKARPVLPAFCDLASALGFDVVLRRKAEISEMAAVPKERLMAGR